MSMYKEVYYMLFREITSVIKIINESEAEPEETLEVIEEILKTAQCAAEEVIISRQDAI